MWKYSVRNRSQFLNLRGMVSAHTTQYDKESFGYCAAQVRQFDYSNFVWIIQLPKDLRAAVLAIRALNVEASLVVDNASEPALQTLRFQWWREGINGCYQDKAPKHPVLVALSQILQHTSLTRYRLQQLVSSREEDAGKEGPVLFDTLQQAEQFADATAGQLQYLQLEAAGAFNSNSHHTAMHLGKAVGLAKLLQGMPFQCHAGRCYLPMDVLRKHSVNIPTMLQSECSAALQDAVLEVASAAKVHLDEARAQVANIPQQARPLMLPSLAADAYLKALEKSDFNVFNPSLVKASQHAGPLYQLQLKWNLLRGTY